MYVCMTDVSLHAVFTELGGVTAAMDLLMAAVRTPPDKDSISQQVTWCHNELIDIAVYLYMSKPQFCFIKLCHV